ncbi:uncharacterized protein LOC120003827 isoform X2 [Tripterygium wilfordii]|uniref:uncharacterized protein LOC120003827 isoform X2 n=1 Tax=Tripterygium wilfordii TaxID=458696 RepID=UPI0018F84013|nr:uncharacterized protein LOC120003827 isoform X2 [Tripterygium wilfordii]
MYQDKTFCCRRRSDVYASCFCCYPEEKGQWWIYNESIIPPGPSKIGAARFNYSSGQPAPESITDKICGNTLSLMASICLYFAMGVLCALH